MPRDRIDSDTGLITETEKSLLFIIPCPWSDDFWIIGTTDTPWNLDLAHPAASRSDIDYILEHANALLAKPLTRDDVVGVYAGLRPLLAGESDSTSKLSREHACVQPVPGLVIVAGGKYTTYRVMAEDAVDEAVKDSAGTCPESVTDKVPLIGADGLRAAVEQPGPPWPPAPGWTSPGSSTCSAATASAIREVLDLIAERPRAAAAAASTPRSTSRSRRTYAASHEGALHLDDILARRLRISIDTWDRGDRRRPRRSPRSSPRCWAGTPRRSTNEIEHYRSSGSTPNASRSSMPDDQTADAARLGAPEVRVGAG